MNPKAFLLFLACMAVMAACAWLIAPSGEKRRAICLAGLGLILALGKIWLIQLTPQWQAIRPDSITYDLNARAFSMHWQGEAVSAEEYGLRGILASHKAGYRGTEWTQKDARPWSSVIGSNNWLYTVYVATWYHLTGAPQSIVILSNAIWAAFFPVASFCIARLLGGTRNVSFLAAALTLGCPWVGVNASWLLKDTLISFLAMLCLCLAMHMTRGKKWRLIPCLGVFGALLSAGRYGAFFGLLGASLMVMTGMIYRQKFGLVFPLAFSMLMAWCLSGALVYMPHVMRSDISFTSASGSIVGVADVLRSNRGSQRADETTIRWKENLAQNPVLAIVKSVGRSLFAPNLLRPLLQGLDWRYSYELYYPGMLLWMLCLPGIFWALRCGVRQGGFTFYLLALFLASQLAAYTIVFGAWSGRQRVMAIPAFYALAAIGWAELYWRWQKSGLGFFKKKA